MVNEARFSIAELLSLLGLAQCIYILVYIAFRTGNVRLVALPFLYFFVLGIAFFADFAHAHLSDMSQSLELLRWAGWYAGPPLSILLIGQLADRSARFRVAGLWPLLLLPLAAITAQSLAHNDQECVADLACGARSGWLIVGGLAAGLFSMMRLWKYRVAISTLPKEKGGPERYWLVMMLVFLNLAFLAVMLASLTPLVQPAAAEMIRTLLGLGLVYLAGTSLFRIYPQGVPILVVKNTVLTDDDTKIAEKIENLLQLDKIYQEAAYNRADLARELDLPEGTVSRIINGHFGKSFPQVLNERRIVDAQLLLQQNDQPVKAIAEQVGFNSIASFNRVFREIVGMTPTEFRAGSEQKQIGKI